MLETILTAWALQDPDNRWEIWEAVHRNWQWEPEYMAHCIQRYGVHPTVMEM